MVRINYDALGIAASLACAIHCAILPLVLSSLPLFGINIINNTGFEYLMIGIAFIIGSYSLWHGYRKHHHKLYPVLLFTAGICLLFMKQYFHEHFIKFLIPAVILIVSAHWLNYTECKRAKHCHVDDCEH
jgi:undecaprenyl pyrophosphate phosphatase UppP